MLDLPEEIVILDLECTTWEGAAARDWSGPGESREVIQLGAVLIETQSFTALGMVKALVRPLINPILSDYCINLTGITQDKLDKDGIDFASALRWFKSLCAKRQLYCFDSRVDGSRLFDRDVLIENCDLHGLAFPFEVERFHNINEIFYQHGYIVKQSGAAPEAFGIKSPARPHDALNDVWGLIIGLKALRERLSK